MSSSDIRDILQIGAAAEPAQKKQKVAEKRPGECEKADSAAQHAYTGPCRWHQSRAVFVDRWSATCGLCQANVQGKIPDKKEGNPMVRRGCIYMYA